MTKEGLEQYCKLKKEIAYLQKRLDKLYEKEVPVVSGKVQASEPQYPCIMRRVSVKMHDPEVNDSRKKIIALLGEREQRCNEKILEIEKYIDSIEDSELRQLFELRYIEGMKLREIADVMNLELSGIGKKITAYLQLSNNSKKTVL